MVKFIGVVALVFFFKFSAQGYPDLIPEAITVYKNPEFYKNLNSDRKVNYNQKSTKVPEGEAQANYKYPGETKKPNPPASPGFEINYDNSPEFHHEPRDIFLDITFKPNRKKGPYGPKYHDENGKQISISNDQKPVREKQNEDEENKESKESGENESVEEPRDFVSVFDENPDEEFKAYHEPILLARPNFDPIQRSGLASNTNSWPYHYNKTNPILYDEWKFYTYPKIHANEHLKSETKLYSEEPSSNSFEDESSSSYFKDDYEGEDVSNFFESDEFKNLGSDTKHIYKKLLKPKKSFLFKFHSKPKFKKLKFKLKKKHLHNSDWFDEYPFDF